MGLREDYQALMEKQLNAWKAQTESSKLRPDRSRGTRRPSMKKISRYCVPNKRKHGNTSDKLKGANESAWAQFKAQMDKAGGEVKDAVERMTTRFKQ